MPLNRIISEILDRARIYGNSLYWGLAVIFMLTACNSDDSYAYDIEDITGNNPNRSAKVLSLGDSYTIGEGVCSGCGFPSQLKHRLLNELEGISVINLQLIAQTGWTTTALLSAINDQNPSGDFDLVTLLIGVNNQYQGAPFSLYEIQFPELVDIAISRAKGRPDKVIVLSIPDYAFTPFGQNAFSPEAISDEIDAYNAFAQAYCEQNNISFLNITDISRQGLDNPDLVASDGLHPSEAAYSLFVDRLLPIAVEKIQ